jgi:uncharacterized membrane protein
VSGSLGRGDASPVRLTETDRTEAFSDGVFAITVTLLVIEVRRPSYEQGGLLDALLEQWPSYLALLVSFVYVFVVWLNHHALFSRIRLMDRGLQWVNFGILLTVAVLPFPTAVLAEALAEGNRADQRVAIALYALVGGLMSMAWIPVFPYLGRHPHLLEDEGDAAYFLAQRARPWTGVGLYLLAGVLGLVIPLLGLAVFGVMVVFHALTSEGLRETPWPRRRRAARS